MPHISIYDQDLDKNAANYLPLTPLGFIERAAQVFPDRPAIIDGDQCYTWRQTYARCCQMANALKARGLKTGETVSIMARNIPAHIEVFFGVPMAGGVINALNVRLDTQMLAFMLQHSETKILLVDRQFSPCIKDVLALMEQPPLVIDIDDTDPELAHHPLIGMVEYEAFLNEGAPDFAWGKYVEDEWQALALNYTSGTTGDPKGVVYHHRGAYLNAVGNMLAWAMPPAPVYLWTLPMFHASGWCFHWTLAAAAGTHICLRKVVAKDIFDLIEKHNVTHFTAAPIVLNFLINAAEEDKKRFATTVEVMTAGSAPPATVLAHMDEMGFNVTHVYGATEVFGPNMSCAWKAEWDALSLEERAKRKARQGVRTPMLEYMIVGDSATCEELPWDGKTIGEVLMRGNVVMKGYLKNPKTTSATFKGGWYHTGDLAVRHPDGYIEVKDRLKDIIISGAENISSIEVESALYKHDAVLEAAVVARPDEKWGETPCAFIELKPGKTVTIEEMVAHCRQHLAGYKIPKTILFGPLEKTPTGKIQKFLLRARAENLKEGEGAVKLASKPSEKAPAPGAKTKKEYV